MGKSPHRRGQRVDFKASAESKVPSNVSGKGYRSPTLGYKDILYSYGTTKAATMFETVNTNLARYVSMQSWSGATIAGRAMEERTEPTLITPKLPSPYEKSEDQEIKKMRTKDSALVEMQMEVYMLHYEVWVGDDLDWKTNRSRLYALVLMHCTPDLEEILTMMSTCKVVSEA